MACETWAESILDRLADELDEEQSIRLEQHLAQCEDCAHEEQRLQKLLSTTAPRREWTPEPSMEDRLLKEMRGLAGRTPSRWRAHSPARRSSGRWMDSLRNILGHRIPAYAAVAALVVAIASGFWIGNTTRSPAEPPGPMGTAPTQLEAPDDLAEPAAHDRLSFAALRRDMQGDHELFATTPADAMSWADVIVDSL